MLDDINSTPDHLNSRYWAAECRRTIARITRGKEPPAEYVDLREGFVYFIQSDAGPIKIGWAKNPDSRRKELQTAHFAKLAVLARTPGTQKNESAYHRQFKEHRLSGEWFNPHEDILSEIYRINNNDLGRYPSGRADRPSDQARNGLGDAATIPNVENCNGNV